MMKFILACAYMIIFSLNLYAKDYVVDIKNSQIEWQGNKGIKILGAHTGSIPVKSSKVSVDNEGNIDLIDISVDMTQITNTDLTGALKDKLLEHLKSDDFFSVAKFPEATFKLQDKANIKNGSSQINGILTIKNISQPLNTNLSIHKMPGMMHVFGAFEFDRTNYNIKYGSGKFFSNLGDMMIHDKIIVNLKLTLLEK